MAQVHAMSSSVSFCRGAPKVSFTEQRKVQVRRQSVSCQQGRALPWSSLNGGHFQAGQRHCLRTSFCSSTRVSRLAVGKRQSKGSRAVVTMGIRAVENFDATFELQPECEEMLMGLLASENFCSQVATQPGVPPNISVKFTGLLFMPVPWSPNTKHGMPQEFEKYLEDKENYVIVNVPPTFMFKAKIFKPSRLCAIYKRESPEA